MNVRDFVLKIKNKEIDVIENTSKAIEELKSINSEYKFMNVISDDLAKSQAEKISNEEKVDDKKLLGLCVSIKDCICVKDVESKAGSAILEGYNPVFDATVIKKLKDQGAIILGKTSQDEFGFGSFNLNVGVGMDYPLNPIDKERVCGGSSGGCAGITKKISIPHVSIAESTGGSIACPASFCGVVGITPTYGRVSRYGLMDYANSLDKIGTMANTVSDAAYVLSLISGYDEKDSTSLNVAVDNLLDYCNKDISGIKIGIIKEAFGKGVDSKVSEKVMNAIESLKSQGAEVSEISLPITSKYALSAYYIIAMSEASTNLSKYCGIRYGKDSKLEGNFNEYFSKVRSENLGVEAKRRIMLGTFARMAGYRDAYYLKSLSVRTKIIEEYKKVFEKYDVIVSPTMPFIAPKISEVENLSAIQNYMADVMTVGPNLAGIPHISVPVGKSDGMPVGMLIISDHLMEKKIVQVASAVERENLE